MDLQDLPKTSRYDQIIDGKPINTTSREAQENFKELHKRNNYIPLYSYKFEKFLRITKIQLVAHRHSEKRRIVKIKKPDTNQTENEKSYCILTRLLTE